MTAARLEATLPTAGPWPCGVETVGRLPPWLRPPAPWLRASADEPAHNADWASNAEHLINLSLAGVLAGMRRPGARVLAVMVAAVLAFMGAAAMTVPANPGSWGTLGGLGAIAGGLAVLAVAAAAGRRGAGEARPTAVSV